MPDAPLSGYGIVITRPADQARQLAELIRQQGGVPIPFPLLEIAPLQDYKTFDQVLERLPTCDWAIFISSNAVDQAMPRLLKRFPTLPAGLRFAAIGPTTATRLAAFSVAGVLIPAGRYDSEQLLTLPEMQQVQGQRIMLFRGEGGRELLAQTLRERGAEVLFAECYRRFNPQADTGELPALWQNGRLQAMVVTSSEALRNLMQLTREAAWLKSVLLCVNHARIAEQARRQGLRVALADGPGDEAMLKCLTQHLINP